MKNASRKLFSYQILFKFLSIILIQAVLMLPCANLVIAQTTPLNLPAVGTQLNLTEDVNVPIIKGVILNPEDPFKFDFIISRGEESLNDSAIKEESLKMVKYFLAALTTPEEDKWVNLSPYEKEKIIPEEFGQTAMGMGMLAQDYMLKQLSASLMSPERKLGSKFWDRVYAKAQTLYGTKDIPINTFNKIWIMPEKAVVFQKDNSAFVVESHLKVMLEEDFLALEKNKAKGKFGAKNPELISGVSAEIVREILIPEIEREVNQGKTFTALRQIYNSVILANWYKENLQKTFISQLYVDKNKTNGINISDKTLKNRIYNQYVSSLKTGVFNFIRKDYDPDTQKNVMRKYFSGGISQSLNATDMGKVGSITETITDADKLSDSQIKYLPASNDLILTVQTVGMQDSVDAIDADSDAELGLVNINDQDLTVVKSYRDEILAARRSEVLNVWNYLNPMTRGLYMVKETFDRVYGQGSALSLSKQVEYLKGLTEADLAAVFRDLEQKAKNFEILVIEEGLRRLPVLVGKGQTYPDYPNVRSVAPGKIPNIRVEGDMPEIGAQAKTAYAFSGNFSSDLVQQQKMFLLQMKLTQAKKAQDEYVAATGKEKDEAVTIVLDNTETAQETARLLNNLKGYIRFDDQSLVSVFSGENPYLTPNVEVLDRYLAKEEKAVKGLRDYLIEITKGAVKGEITQELKDEFKSRQKSLIVLRTKVAELKKQAASITPVTNGQGQWEFQDLNEGDFIKSLILSGKLGELKRNGTSLIFYSDIHNPTAAADKYIKGYFLQRVNAALAKGQTPPVMVRFLTDKTSQEGVYAEVKYEDGTTRKEVINTKDLPENVQNQINEDDFTLASTGSYLLSVDAILQRYGLEANYHRNLNSQELMKIINNVDQQDMSGTTKVEEIELADGSSRFGVKYNPVSFDRLSAIDIYIGRSNYTPMTKAEHFDWETEEGRKAAEALVGVKKDLGNYLTWPVLETPTASDLKEKLYPTLPGNYNDPIAQGKEKLVIPENTRVVIGGLGMIGNSTARLLKEAGENVIIVDNLLLGTSLNELDGVDTYYMSASEFARRFTPESYKNIKEIYYLGGHSSAPMFYRRRAYAQEGERSEDEEREFQNLLKILNKDFSPDIAEFVKAYPEYASSIYLQDIAEYRTVLRLAQAYGIKVGAASTSSFTKLYSVAKIGETPDPVPEVPTLEVIQDLIDNKNDPEKSKESTNLTTGYEMMKLSMEVLAMEFHKKFGVEAKMTRNFSVYHGGLAEVAKTRYANMVTQFKDAVEYDKHIFLFVVPGDFKRDIIYSDDLASGLIHVLRHGKWEGTPQNSAAVWNVGLQKAYGMNEMMSMIFDAIGKGSEKNVRAVTYPDGFPPYTYGSNTKLTSTTGEAGEKWTPISIDFARSLEEIFFLNSEYYDRLSKMEEETIEPQTVDVEKLKQQGFKEIIPLVWQKGVYTVVLNEEGNLAGLYIEREEVGPAKITYFGEDKFNEEGKPTQIKEQIKTVTWSENPIDYDEAIIPISYIPAQRRMVFLNGDNVLTVGRQLAWQVFSRQDWEKENGALEVLDNPQAGIDALVEAGILESTISGVYVSRHREEGKEDIVGEIMVVAQDGKIKLVTAKPHVGVKSDLITKATTVSVPDAESENLLVLRTGNIEFSLDKRGATVWTKVVDVGKIEPTIDLDVFGETTDEVAKREYWALLFEYGYLRYDEAGAHKTKKLGLLLNAIKPLLDQGEAALEQLEQALTDVMPEVEFARKRNIFMHLSEALLGDVTKSVVIWNSFGNVVDSVSGFRVNSRNTTDAIMNVERFGAFPTQTYERVEEELKSGSKVSPPEHFMGEEEDLHRVLLTNRIIADCAGKGQTQLGGHLYYAIRYLDTVFGEGATEKPLRYEYYGGDTYEVVQNFSNRLANPFNEFTSKLRGGYTIKNLRTGKSISFEGNLPNALTKYGFSGGEQAAWNDRANVHFNLDIVDIMELFNDTPAEGVSLEDIRELKNRIAKISTEELVQIGKRLDEVFSGQYTKNDLFGDQARTHVVQEILKELREKQTPRVLGVKINEKDAALLERFKYFTTEQAVTEEYSEIIQGGVDPKEYNLVKGQMNGTADAIDATKLSAEEAERLSKLGERAKVAVGFAAGGLSTRTGGLFTAGFKWLTPGISADTEYGFLDYKFATAKKAGDDYEQATGEAYTPKVVPMASFNTDTVVEQVLTDNDYFGYGEDNVSVFYQGVQLRLNPNEQYLDSYYESKKKSLEAAVQAGDKTEEEKDAELGALARGIAKQKAIGAGVPVTKADGSLVMNPPGTFDYIKHLVFSGRLAELKAAGTDFLFYSHMNNPAGKPDALLLGIFLDAINKARDAGQAIPAVMPLLGANRGEKGGLFAEVTYQGQTVRRIVEASAFPDDVKQAMSTLTDTELANIYPYFHTGMNILSVDGLLEAFGLPADYDQSMQVEEVAAQFAKFEAQVPVYINTKETKDEIDGQAYTYVGFQLERDYGDAYVYLPNVWTVVDRTTQFVPTKTLDNVDLNSEKGRKHLDELANANKKLIPYLPEQDNNKEGPLGGIYFGNVELRIDRPGKSALNVPVSFNALNTITIDGLMPVIIDIKPFNIQLIPGLTSSNNQKTIELSNLINFTTDASVFATLAPEVNIADAVFRSVFNSELEEKNASVAPATDLGAFVMSSSTPVYGYPEKREVKDTRQILALINSAI